MPVREAGREELLAGVTMDDGMKNSPPVMEVTEATSDAGGTLISVETTLLDESGPSTTSA